MFQDKDMVKYGMEKWESGSGQNLWVHSRENCKGPYCPIHNPSDHHMKDWPLHWRDDRRIMERICVHGVGHPDPDDNNTDDVHGCCGCCSARDTVEECLEANMMNGNPVMVFDDGNSGTDI